MKKIKRMIKSLFGMEENSLTFQSELSAKVIRKGGGIENKGLLSKKIVTTAGVEALTDAFQGLFTISDFKYHGMGTGIGDELVGNTALGTEVETRATGSQAEGASANIYKTIGTITATAPRVITEHGIFSAAAAGTLWDRSLFAAINLASGDSIQFTYSLTCTAGG